MFMGMAAQIMGPGVAAMAMSMEMEVAAAVPMGVEVDPGPPQPVKRVGAERHQHDADGELEAVGEAIVDGHLEEYDAAAEHRQHQGMAEAPDGAVPGDPRDPGLAANQARYRGDMIRFQRMLQADDEAEKQYRQHGRPRS